MWISGPRELCADVHSPGPLYVTPASYIVLRMKRMQHGHITLEILMQWHSPRKIGVLYDFDLVSI